MRVAIGASASTLACFLVLPLIQAISQPPGPDLLVRAADTAVLPPPPPPPPPPPEKDRETEQEPPKLAEASKPLDLAQLELVLNPGQGTGWLGDDAALRFAKAESVAGDVDALFGLADLDQKPRPRSQPEPLLTPKARAKTPGWVRMVFTVDVSGKVENPSVESSSDPVFEQPTLDAVKRWTYFPGTRNGKPVRFRVRVPITFPKS